MPVHIKNSLIGSAATIVAALAICAALRREGFITWVAYLGVVPVPMMLVAGFLWRIDPPQFLHRLRQPARGMRLAILTLASAVAGAAFLYWGPGRGAGPTPMLVMAAIVSVVATFWVVVVWRCWPLSTALKHPLPLGIAAWLVSYGVGFLAFVRLFNFDFMAAAAIYSPIADPHGAFNAWRSLVFLVTTTGVISVFSKLFAYWPVASLPGSARPACFALYASLYVLALSALAIELGVHLIGMDQVDFMVEVPVSLIFGTFLVTSMTRFRLLGGWPQPAKGTLLLVIGGGFGAALFALYAWIAPLLAGESLVKGPPHYSLELWIATAMLSVTFPLIILFANYFDLWPLERGNTTAGAWRGRVSRDRFGAEHPIRKTL